MSTPTLPTELPRDLSTYKEYKLTNAAVHAATVGALAQVPAGDTNALVVYGAAQADKGWGIAVARKFKNDWTIVFAGGAEKSKPVGVEVSIVHSWK